MSLFSDCEFNTCVEKYNGNYKIRTFSCRDHFYVMCFEQLTYCYSLRAIEICLRALSNKLYHSGIRCAISKSVLAKANALKKSSIYFDFAQTLILEARSLYVKTNPLIAEINLMSYT